MWIVSRILQGFGKVLNKPLVDIVSIVVAWVVLPLRLQATDKALSQWCEYAFNAIWDLGSAWFGGSSWFATGFALINNVAKGGLVIKFLIVSFVVGLAFSVVKWIIAFLWTQVSAGLHRAAAKKR